MRKKSALALILLACALSPLMLVSLTVQADGQYPHLSDQEAQVVSLVNGTRAYDYDLELERIALDHGNSDYAFRSAGSPNANRTADWIKDQFDSFGLETSLESFQFTAWNLPGQPILVLDEDGNPNTAVDQTSVRSFQCQHFSWPTVANGTFADICVLPMPDGLLYGNFRQQNMPLGVKLEWNDINTTGKIVLVGREVNWYGPWRERLMRVIDSQRPVALVYTWWHDWMNFTPPFFGSAAGTALWNLKLPVGWVNYADGMLIRQKRNSTANVWATIKIPAVIENGTHSNVVGKLKGKTDSDRCVIISGHYDTVMDAGFCDNGAGTAGVIELARVFKQAAETGIYTPDQTLVFIAFTAEELGFIGSIDYIKRHSLDMKNIDAVINLDCIGHDLLTVSETLADDRGLRLDQTVIKAAQDLGVAVETEPIEVGGSDQETFRNPVEAGIFERDFWGIDPAVNATVRVKSSTMLGSSPLFYYEKLLGRTPGWIHTEYDNSTSTLTLGWVETEDLEGHIRTAALATMRALSTLYNPLMSQVTMGAMIATVVLMVLAVLERSKVKKAVRKVRDEIGWYINTKEVLIILLLFAFLLFSSYAATATVARKEVIVRNIPTIVTVRYFGYPFDMIEIPALTQRLTTDLETAISQASSTPETSAPQVLWIGLAANMLIFAVSSLILVYLGARLWEAFSSSSKPAESPTST